ncbi:hypothetical protein ANN_12900 [Periplaneta americana]|uniref:Uncharacterized protein n=1 Tax=Periplaneta americana TaxID=6978 RepID=A0ABQ8TJV9_PERAM|nr:hypothetical protein ANN_12900 [Periplaneta americana]
MTDHLAEDYGKGEFLKWEILTSFIQRYFEANITNIIYLDFLEKFAFPQLDKIESTGLKITYRDDPVQPHYANEIRHVLTAISGSVSWKKWFNSMADEKFRPYTTELYFMTILEKY